MENLPRHIALIMDGNRRWAKEKKLSPFFGHQEGEKRIGPIIDEAIKLGIPFLTFWAFSTENWKRTQEEIEFLLNLYRHNLEKKVDEWHRKKVRVKVIGNLSLFPQDIQQKTKQWMERTKDNQKITVNFALSYGGRDEILRAVNRWLKEKKNEAFLTKETLETYLDTAGQPDPDLLIRTGGEKRISGFLLWQLEYTELYFTDVYWPDFTPKHFLEAINDFQKRQRRFGR